MIQIPNINPTGLETAAYWEDFLSKEDLELLTNLKEWNKTSEAQVGGTSKDIKSDSNIRRTNISWLPFEEKFYPIYNRFAEVIAEVNSKFFHLNISHIAEQSQLGLYTEKDKDHYDWHTDASPYDRLYPRKLSMILMLSDSDEYEGGELQIKTNHQDLILESKKGRAWFFPSYLLHRVTPVTKGTRKTLVTWITGEAFK